MSDEFIPCAIADNRDNWISYIYRSSIVPRELSPYASKLEVSMYHYSIDDDFSYIIAPDYRYPTYDDIVPFVGYYYEMSPEMRYTEE